MKTWEEYLAYAKNCTDPHGHDEELWIGKDQYNSILTNARADLLKENQALRNKNIELNAILQSALPPSPSSIASLEKNVNKAVALLKENAELKQQLSEAREQVKVMREALRLWMKTFEPTSRALDGEGNIRRKCQCEICQAIRVTEKLIE